MSATRAKRPRARLTDEAKGAIRSRRHEFTAHLIAMARVAASSEGHRNVAEKHVADAYRFITRGSSPENRKLYLISQFSGVFLGVSLSFLYAELSRDGGARFWPAAIGIVVAVASGMAMVICAPAKV